MLQHEFYFINIFYFLGGLLFEALHQLLVLDDQQVADVLCPLDPRKDPPREQLSWLPDSTSAILFLFMDDYGPASFIRIV